MRLYRNKVIMVIIGKGRKLESAHWGGGGIGNTREKTIFEREYLVVECVRTI